MRFLRELARAGTKVSWDCLAFCVLGTHYHLVLDVDDGALSKGMHALNFRYAMGFNSRHRMKGHVTGRRFDSRRIEDDDDLLGVFAYVARNPVKAGLCASPVEWPWSSYPSTVGLSEPSSFVDANRIVGCLGEGREVAIARLRKFVENS